LTGGLLSEEHTAKTISLALSGIIGYYGRAAIITWEDAVKIEEARVEVLRSKGITNGKPRAAIYGDRQSGLQHEHAYAYATRD